MDWVTASKHFVLIVDSGSFAEAARQRYTSSSALSKQISWLENHLNTTLLNRTTRHLSLTEAGKTFYEEARHILETIDALEKNVQTDATLLRGTLRVSCYAISSCSSLLDVIQQFIRANPEVRIELLEDARQQDMAALGVDLALIPGGAYQDHYVQKYIGKMQLNVYGAPAYFEKHGVPKHPHELVNHDCLLHIDLQKQARWIFKDDIIVPVKGSFAACTYAPLIEAAKNGLGLIQISDSLISCYVEKKTLIPVLESFSDKCIKKYAVYPKQGYPNRIRDAFVDFLKAQCVFSQSGLDEDCSSPTL